MRLAPSRVALAFVLASLPGLLPGPRAAWGGPSKDFDAAVTSFKREMGQEAPEARMRAFQRMGEVRDPRAVEVLLGGVDKMRERRDKVVASQAEAETALEAILGEIEKANRKTPTTPREIEAYNARMRKAETTRNELYAKLRDLAGAAAQERAVLGSGVAALGTLVGSLPAEGAQAALDAIAASWTGPKSLPEEQVAWVDVLTSVTSVPTGPILAKLALDASLDPRLRVAALSARVARRDVGTLEDCVALLPCTSWPVAAEAIDGLRRLHLSQGIEPLIEALGREDLGRLREDVVRALRSLTAQKHGMFQQPWKDWWTEAKATFTMPEKPAEYGDLVAADKAAVTFYGITTFSDRLLFVLDVSGSMDELAHPDASGSRALEKRIDVARRELSAALDMLDEKKRFNLLFFNHGLIRYEGAMVDATDAATQRAARFFKEDKGLQPAGGTNIHDALETAFLRIANAGSADGKTYLPVVDTIFFMTDGWPTAGKLQDPEKILEAVRTWNRTAKITIHVIGTGDREKDDGYAKFGKFLKDLAAENGGVFVQR